MELGNFSQIETFLSQFVPVKPGAYKLERMEKLMTLLDSPQEKVSIIHIAGTSGKTSTAYYCAALLVQSGAKVGLTVSPHIFEVNERVQINGEPLQELIFCKLFKEFIEINGLKELNPTYFELLVAFAFWCFVKEGCTHAVVEVGLGGLLDGTNVINNPQKVAVITDIGLDHTNVLGETIEEIAVQKAGIIKPHNQVFTYYQDEVIQDVILASCRSNHALLQRIDQPEIEVKYSYLPNLPLYQRRNWLLATQVVDFVVFRDGLKVLNDADLLFSQSIVIPARLEKIEIDGQYIIADGAHNPQKLQAMCTSLKSMHPNSSITCLVAFAGTKEPTVRQSLKVLREISNDIVVTEFSISEDYAHTSLPCQKVAGIAREVGFEKVHSNSDLIQALGSLKNAKSDIKLVTGSFYLIAALKPYLGRNI